MNHSSNPSGVGREPSASSAEAPLIPERSDADRAIHDLSRALPHGALSESHQRGRWKIVPYRMSDGTEGKSLWAHSNAQAPDLEIPLNARGWHAVYLGVGGAAVPGHPNPARHGIRVKLSGDRIYQYRGHKRGICEDVLFECADLTGQTLCIGQQSAGHALPASLYYVRLVPLAPETVERLQRERCQSTDRRLIGTMDGFSFLYQHAPTTRDELLSLFEPFRYSDFGTIWWQYVGADLVNYRSRLGTLPGAFTDLPPRPGDGYFVRAVHELMANGVDITRAAVEACHERGMKIHIAMRPAAWRAIIPWEDFFVSAFYRNHPEWRCRDRDGTPVARMSFAVPEVRQHLLGIFREVLAANPDGLNVLFNRGTPLVLWEPAFCDRFREQFGEDPREIPKDDPRIYALRSDILTDWMREVRNLLDEHRRETRCKDRLQLTIMCLATEKDNLQYGIDPARWVRGGWIDQIGIWHSPGSPIDLTWFRSMVNGTGVKWFPALVSWQMPDVETVRRQALEWYDEGADGMVVWDPESQVGDAQSWPVYRRLGHVGEMRQRAAKEKSDVAQPVFEHVGDEPPTRWSPQTGF